MPTILQNLTSVTFSGASSASATFGAALTNSSSILVATSWDDVSVTMTAADNVNAGNYTADAAASSGATYSKASAHSKDNTGTTAATVTVTFSASTYGQVKVYESTRAVLDTFANTGGGSGTTPSATTGSAQANGLAIACLSSYGTATAADTGFTLAPASTGGNNSYHIGEYKADTGGAGALTVSFGASGSYSYWALAAAIYKDAASASDANAGPWTAKQEWRGIGGGPRSQAITRQRGAFG